MAPRKRRANGVNSATSSKNHTSSQAPPRTSRPPPLLSDPSMAHLLHEIEPYNKPGFESAGASGASTPLTDTNTGAGASRPRNGYNRFKEPTSPNILEVMLGNWWIKPWFPSFYPEELVGKTCERLFVCAYCFKYTGEEGRIGMGAGGYLRHMQTCPYTSIPSQLGPPVYQTAQYSIHEFDGASHTLFAQNLSLFAKLFLDTKSVFYDVSTFLYYPLVWRDPNAPKGTPPQIVGFFSKEKLSWDSNNLACILIFPPWQRKGLGQVLMSLSYALGRQEGRLGGPEKPLSELGRQAYVAYWGGCIARHILSLPKNKSATVESIAEATWIVNEDIISTLREMGVLEQRGGGTPRKKGKAVVAINKAKVREWMERNRVSRKEPIDEENIVWENTVAGEVDDEDYEDE